jgi:hypothetical protein
MQADALHIEAAGAVLRGDFVGAGTLMTRAAELVDQAAAAAAEGLSAACVAGNEPAN